MNTINNSRSKKTKNNLKETILMLMADGKSINKVSIKEICEKSGINRSTFYAHYSIPEEIEKEIEDETLEETRKYISSIKGNEQENTTLLLFYIKKNQETFRILLNAQNKSFSDQLIAQILPIFQRIELVPFPKYMFHYIKDYVINGAKAIIISWINNGCMEDEEQISKLIIVLSKKVIDTAFIQK